jgi:hypothetical protein
MSVAEIIRDGKLDEEAANKALDEFETSNSPPADEPADDTTPAEVESGEGEAEVQDEAEEDWAASLSEDMQELVDSLGLSEEEVHEFSGPEELQRHAHLLDRQIVRMGDKLRPGDEQDAAMLAQEEAEKKLASQERVGKQARGEDGKFVAEYSLDLKEEDYDEGIVKEFRKLAGHFEGRIKSLEGLLRQSESRLRETEQQQYDTLIDTLGHEDLFGNSEKVRTAEQKKNRSRLLQTVDVLRAGFSAMGREVAVTPSLVKRALNQEFAEKLTAKQRRDFTRKVQEQSKRRLAGAGQRASLNDKAPWKGDPVRDPILLEAYESIMREAGGK